MPINTNDLEVLFKSDSIQPNYFDLGINNDKFERAPISKREISTLKSFQEKKISEIAGAEGSPSFEIIRDLVNVLKRLNILPELSGFGVELGSGIGLLSAAIIEQDLSLRIKGILAIEAVLPFVDFGIKFTAREILKNNHYKILPCYGSFNSLDICKETIDFIFQIEALHHADYLVPPISEAFRILKKGGYFVSIDRSWPNETNRIVLEQLLNHEYPLEWLHKKGLPPEKFTRRDNGEHEYVDSEWIFAFEKSGFTMINMVHAHPELTIYSFMKRIICLLRLNKIFRIKIKSRTGIIRSFLLHKLNLKTLKFSSIVISPHPRPLTIFVWQKN